MTEIRFYHLQKQTLDQALPLILEKAYQTGKNIVVRLADDKEVVRMNGILWTYKTNSFLPHGSKKDGSANQQPIWLTHENDNPNEADILVLTQGQEGQDVQKYSLCCEILDGHNETTVQQARERWKKYQSDGHEVTYWFQDNNGKWNKKA